MLISNWNNEIIFGVFGNQTDMFAITPRILCFLIYIWRVRICKARIRIYNWIDWFTNRCFLDCSWNVTLSRLHLMSSRLQLDWLNYKPLFSQLLLECYAFLFTFDGFEFTMLEFAFTSGVPGLQLMVSKFKWEEMNCI